MATRRKATRGHARAQRAKTHQDVFSILERDHDHVKELLSKLEAETGTDERKDLLTQIADEIRVHSRLEEELVYPAIRDSGDEFEDKYYKAVEEHHLVDTIIPELETIDPDADEFPAKVMVLKEVIEHHIDEEEVELFAKARKALSAEQLSELETRVDERRTQLTQLDPDELRTSRHRS